MFETHVFEIFLWKSLAIVKLQVYQFFPKKSAGSQVFAMFLKYLFQGWKPILQKTSEWLLPMFHVFIFRFFLNIVNRAEGIWASDN